ncbi:MAG TPA: PAS domain S-box protein [Gallionellaceae bacterium]
MMRFAATLLVLALLAYAAFLASRSWRDAKAGQASQLATIAALSENSLDVYLTQLQIAMQNLGEDLGSARSKPDLDRAFTLVRRFQTLHAELGNVMLIRGDGQVLLTGTTPNRADLPTLAGDPAYTEILAELQAPPHFAIGRPVVGNIDRSWVVSARYAVTDQTGKLAYVISANLPADMLQRYQVDSVTPRISALGLLRDDGYLVSRHPQPEGADMDAMYGQPARGAMADYLRVNNHPQQGQVELKDSEGNTTGLQAARRLQHFPLTVLVEMSMSEVRAAWWHDMRAPYFVMALLLACAFAFYSLKRRRAWTEAQRREALRHSYEEALLEGSPNEILIFDTDTLQITYANDAALKNLGYTLEQLQQKNLFSLQPQSNLESFEGMIEPLLRDEQDAINYETTQARANGSSYPVEVNLELIAAEDGSERFLAIINDLTAVKQAEENIRKLNTPVERRAARTK